MKKLLWFFLIFNGLLYSQQNQAYMNAIGLPSAWNITQGNPDVIIAVLGNGIHTNHPALANVLSEIPGWNFYNNNSNISESRTGNNGKYTHETAVAGIIAAQQTVYNNYLVKGIASNCKIMPVKFYEPNDPNDPEMALKLASAFNYVKNKQVQNPEKRFLINLSYTFPDFNETEKNLVAAAIQNCYNEGIPIFCSVGNNNGTPVQFPASLPTTFAITGILGGANNAFNYVDPGFYPTGEGIDLAAPNIVTYTSMDDSYNAFSHTSAAAPQACGTAALVLSIDKNMPLEKLRTLLHKNGYKDNIIGTTFNENGYSEKIGYGRVDAGKSVLKINIPFVNDVEGNLFLGTLTVQGETLNSGESRQFYYREEITAKINNSFFNYNSYLNKFYTWNYYDFNTPGITGREFINIFDTKDYVDYFFENISAEYKKTKPLTVRNYLEGGNGGNILFGEKDFDVINRTSPYNENAFIYNLQGGVNAIYRSEAEPTHNIFNTTWNFLWWENGSTNRIREEQVTQNSPSEWNAIYKGIQRSNQTDAYNSNSQRKAVRLVNGNLINIYSSLGKNWIEKSSDNGQSWSLLNGVNPLYNQDEFFASSLDEIPWSGPYSHFVIVNGYVTSAIDNKIRLNIIRTNSPYNVYSDEIFMYKGQNVSLPFTPVVAVSEDRILIVCNGGIDQNGQVGLICNASREKILLVKKECGLNAVIS